MIDTVEALRYVRVQDVFRPVSDRVEDCFNRVVT